MLELCVTEQWPLYEGRCWVESVPSANFQLRLAVTNYDREILIRHRLQGKNWSIR
jgi:hypothetical protein